MHLLRIVLQLASSAILLLPAGPAAAQGNGQLYEPAPPPDSVYVRVIMADRAGAVDVLVDGKVRQRGVPAGEAGAYLVLAAGKHTLSLQRSGAAPGKAGTTASVALDLASGRAMTIAFPALRAEVSPWIFEDKTSSNKLKAVLTVYQLDAQAGTLDVLSADGNTRVFSGIAPGNSNSLQVNPITIDLIATRPGDKTARANVTVAMTPGDMVSVLLLPGPGGKLSAHASQNKIHKFAVGM